MTRGNVPLAAQPLDFVETSQQYDSFVIFRVTVGALMAEFGVPLDLPLTRLSFIRRARPPAAVLAVCREDARHAATSEAPG